MRWKALAAVLALSAAAVIIAIFYMDSFVKGKIESEGSSAVGAKVTLGSLNISLSEQSVTITDLQVADPDDPWKNLFEMKSAKFDFSLPQFLLGRLIIENVAMDTPRWGMKRKSYGGIKKESKPVKKAAPPAPKGKGFDIDWSKYLPKVDLQKEFSVESIVNPEKMESLKKLEEAKKFVEGRDEKWKTRIDGISKEYEAVQKSRDPIKIAEFIKTVYAVRKELEGDVKRVEETVKLIRKLRDEDLKDIASLIGIGGTGGGGISREIFSDAFRETVVKGYRLFTRYREKLLGSKKGEEKKDRLKGVTVAFPVKDPKPRFHIIKALLNVDKAARKGNWLAGTVKDVTSNPKMVGRPVDFRFEAGSESFPGAQFAVTGVVDLTGAVSRFELKTSAKKLSTKPASSALGSGSPVALSGGAMNVNSDFKVEGGVVKSVFNLALNGVTLSIREKALAGTDPSVKRILSGTLSDVKKITVSGKAQGKIDSLRIAISSNIDTIFKKALDRAVSRARGEMEKRIRDELNKRIAEQVPGLEGILGDDAKEIRDIDSAIKTAQKKIEDEVKKRIDAERKKQEERLKKELEKEKKKQEDKLKEELKKRLKLPF